MRVLITGAGGFLGSHLISFLKQDPKTGSVSSTVTSKKTIGVDQSAGKSDTKSLVNPNKKQNVKNAKNLKKDFTKVDKQTSSMSIDKEPKAQVDVGSFSGPGGF